MRVSFKVGGLMAGAAWLAVLGVPVSYWAFAQIKDAAEERRHTQDVIVRAQDLLSSLVDAETGQRGYVITGDASFLQPYLAVHDKVDGRLAELRRLTQVASAQERLTALGPLIEAKLASMAEVVRLRRHDDTAQAAALVRGGLGMRQLDAVRSEILAFSAIEEEVLARREVQFQSSMRRLFVFLAAASVVALLLASSFAYLIFRESQHRLRTQALAETQKLLALQQETNQQLQLANHTLQVSEERLAVTLHSIGDGVIAADANGGVTLLNPLAERLTGWTQAEAAGRPVGEVFCIINQETRQPSVVPVKETLARGTIQGLANHTILLARGGGECPIADSCAPIRDRNGEVVGAVLVFRDVTGEERARQELKDSAAFIQTVLNTVGDGIVTLRAAGGVVARANPAMERMFGYAVDEILGQSFSRLVPELNGDQPAGTVEYYSAGAEARAAGLGREVVGRRKDGGTFPLEITLREMELGGTRFFTGILRDLTARRRAEEAFFKAGTLQRAIFNSANFSSIATDEKGVIQLFNVGAERMLGYTAAEVLNKVTPADISDWTEVVARAKALSVELATPINPGFEALVFKASRGIEDIYELNYVRKNGSRLPAVVSVTALRDPQNLIIGFLLIGTDNTARKQIESEQQLLAQRLRDQQFYTRSLFEANIDALMTTDPAGIITDVNKQMEALTGSTRDELIGAPFKSYFTDPERAENSINLVLSEKKNTNYELTARARDGTETRVSYNATTFYDRDRRLQGMFAAARDVSERQRADEDLRRVLAELHQANTNLAQSSRLKDEFLANMSHELRTPLNAILGLSETMLEQISGPLTPRQTRSLTTISTSGQHLLSLINDILDLSKIEAGKLALNLATVSVDEFCQSCLAFVRSQATQKRISITVASDQQLPTFQADPKRFKQVIVNLLTNAVKFTPEGGRIGLTVTAPPGEDAVRFTVWDTGIGIAAGDAAHLFRAFTQIDSGLSRAQEGTGLGLALVAKLVELHGGSVVLESAPGQGSRFIVTLPRMAVAPAPLIVLPAAESGAAPRNFRRALIIEDDPTSGAILVNFLTELGLTSVVQLRGEAAVETVLRERPDIVLLDILLPGESGWVVLARLKEHPQCREIPVVVVSFVDEPQKSLALGALAHLTKPVSRAQLLRILRPGAKPTPSPAGRDLSSRGPLVLLAEDNEANIETLGGYLTDKGYMMHYATNGLIAVKLARELRPAVILMDVQMPVMDGLAAIREIRADPLIRDVPIVALTALAMPGDRERCLATGATDYLSKPVSLKVLAALLEKLVGKGRP